METDRKKNRYIAIAGVIALSLIVSVASAGNTAEATVTAFHKALEQGDRDAVLGLLSENVRIFEQGWVEQSRAEYASHHLDSDIGYAKAVKSEVSNVEVSIDGALAVVMSQSTTKGTYDGKPVDSVGLETMVLRKTGDAWKIVHIHWSSRKAGK
jgi:ketosteroid isomerase-like protein